MEKIVNRSDVAKLNEYFELILETECHHDHIIIEDDQGTLRWKEKNRMNDLIENCGGLNNVLYLFYNLGHGKNTEIYRQLYRDMGYSINGYWEIFYWEFNNEKFEEYIEKRKILNRGFKINKLLK